MNRGSRRKMFRAQEFALAEYEAEERHGSLDDIVSVTITATPISTLPRRESFAPSFGHMDYQNTLGKEPLRVRHFRHWTELALAGFGTDRFIRRAKQWLKRRARARRKRRRGYP